MAHATATIGANRYRTTIVAGGHQLTADEPEALGGADSGPAPFDLLLAALGACTAITLRMYAEKKGWPLESLDIAERTPVTLTLKAGIPIATTLI
ncbi:OsmC family protein [Rhizorhabdus sp. FW153]|uniref:OsmC family protein n=1 Tax=Rhizorhabdus sp. FW153 TaxID=3400216 RepID=UPI003CEF058B